MSAYPNLASVPISHTEDPQPSRIAAVEHTASGARAHQALRVRRLVYANPGRTAAELASLSEGLDRVQVARRLTDLAHLNQIERGTQRQCEVSGRACSTWWPVGQGRLL